MDYSLDLIKLQEVYEKVYRNRRFTERDTIDHICTRHIINVTFKYSNKIYNRIASNVYVRFGYNYNQCVLKDNVCIQNGQLVAIKVFEESKFHRDIEQYIVDSPISQELLGKYFYYDEEYRVYRTKNNFETLNSVSDIRTELYENGFVCDGIKFVRFKRSSGSSRVGKCLFIDEKLYKQMHKWEMCGINIKRGQECDLASLEPYIALTLSSIIDTIEISPNQILVIDDYKSSFKTTCMATELNQEGRLTTAPKTLTISNNIWDGQSLLDSSMFGNYSQYGMLLLRARFFKSACFNTNIQQWFKDNGITEVSQLNGYTQAEDISEIKLITTPSSIKYLKFGSLDDWLWTLGLEPVFGIVKHEKPTHYFDGRMVQTHYQLLNTLQMTQDEVAEFLKPTIDYINLLKTDPDVLRYHIKYSAQDYSQPKKLLSANDIVYRMLGLNNRFQYTQMYKNFRNKIVKSFIKNIRKGHVYVHGNYSTLCGNPLEMLKSAINTFDGKSSIEIGTLYCKAFQDGANLLGSRSPHVTMGNVLCSTNKTVSQIDKYFNLSNEIVCINSIGDNILERLSGCDFDSDTLLLTDNEILYKVAIRNYDNFLVPTKLVHSKDCKRCYTSRDKSDIDIKTGSNKIGDIINLSQELNSKLWELIYQGFGTQSKDVQSLYADIAQLDVMSNLEIDAAKRENPANNTMELRLLKDKYAQYDKHGKYIRPLFFKYIDKYKGYIGNKSYRLHHTTMDYLAKELSKRQCKLYGNTTIPFSDIFVPLQNINGRVYKEQVERILTIIQDTQQEIKVLWANKECSLNKDINYHELVETYKTICAKRIQNLKISPKTMRYMISLIECPLHKQYTSLLTRCLLSYANVDFNELVCMSQESILELQEHFNGDIDLFGIRFQKHKTTITPSL